MRTAIWVALALIAVPAFAAATGRVVGPDGAPIRGAQVCEFIDDASERCVKVDASGVYRIDKPAATSLLVRASGFVARVVDAAPLNEPIALQPAAILEVTVVDAVTKKPLPSGKVMLDSPSGRRIGKFVPFNKQGVRISTLDPGDVFVRADADGYERGGPVPVTLVSGVKRTVVVPMYKTDAIQH